jgi:hypothetical protein
MTESTLWASTAEALPNNARALFNLANELTKSPRVEDKVRALQYYDKACGIAGDNMFYYNYGCAFTGVAGQKEMDPAMLPASLPCDLQVFFGEWLLHVVNL